MKTLTTIVALAAILTVVVILVEKGGTHEDGVPYILEMDSDPDNPDYQPDEDEDEESSNDDEQPRFTKQAGAA